MSQATMPMKRPNVTVRPATILPFSQMPINSTTRRRVAAYARVSTDSEEQIESYNAQVAYFTEHIQSKPEWMFAGMYADEGLSGLQLKKRDRFNDMIADAIAGKIDLIEVKSVSRFARNTVHTLQIVRELKAAGVEVHFQKENIFTFDSKAELVLTIMASLSQEESRSISENVTWGVRKRMAEGKFGLPYKNFLGYQKGPDGKPEIVEEQAEVVRTIYSLYLQGATTNNIAKYLMERGVPTPAGKVKWSVSTVHSILINEKYKGDANLQKTFTLDFLEKKRKWNDGEVEQYYHTGTHEAIVEPWVFDQAQAEMKRRQALGRSFSGGIFGSRIVCGECGGLYGPKVWHSNTKHRRTIYRCNQKYGKDKNRCSTPYCTEDVIKSAFVTVFNRMLPNKDSIITACREAIQMISDTDALGAERAVIVGQLEELSKAIRQLINRNASTAQDQDAYSADYETLTSQSVEASERLGSVDRALCDRKSRCIELEMYIGALESTGDFLVEFNPLLWNAVVDTVTIQKDGAMVFRFRDGQENVWR